MAAEAVSMTFLQSVLKGLQRSPRIVTDREAMREAHVLTARDVSCLVLPQGCLGLPTLAALEQGIPVIEVEENANLMRNDLSALPWRQGQHHRVANYWEAAGVMAALKAGGQPDVGAASAGGGAGGEEFAVSIVSAAWSHRRGENFVFRSIPVISAHLQFWR